MWNYRGSSARHAECALMVDDRDGFDSFSVHLTSHTQSSQLSQPSVVLTGHILLAGSTEILFEVEPQ
jgi:hypothetical protein